MRISKNAPRDPIRILERTHGLAEIIDRGVGVLIERPRVNRPHFERHRITPTKNTLGHEYRFAQHRLAFF
jgi:hypothetical protein